MTEQPSDQVHIIVFALTAYALSAMTAGVCFAHGDLDLRIEGATRQIQAQPADPHWYLRRADLHREHRDWSLAEQDIRTAEALDPSSPQPLYYRALLLRDRGEPTLAVDRLQRFLSSESGRDTGGQMRAKVHAELGRVLADLARWRDAADQLSMAIALADSPAPELFVARAEALAKTGDSRWAQEALQGLDQGIEKLGAGTILSDYAVDIAWQSGDVDGALARIEQRIQVPGYRLPAMVRKAEILEQAGRGAAARTAYADAERALDALPAKVRSTPGIRGLSLRAAAGKRRLHSPSDDAPPVVSGAPAAD